MAQHRDLQAGWLAGRRIDGRCARPGAGDVTPSVTVSCSSSSSSVIARHAQTPDAATRHSHGSVGLVSTTLPLTDVLLSSLSVYQSLASRTRPNTMSHNYTGFTVIALTPTIFDVLYLDTKLIHYYSAPNRCYGVLWSACLSVCLSVCLSTSISSKLHVRSSPLFVRVTYGRGSVLIWWRCDKLCTSGLWMTPYLHISGHMRHIGWYCCSDCEWRHCVVVHGYSAAAASYWFRCGEDDGGRHRAISVGRRGRSLQSISHEF